MTMLRSHLILFVVLSFPLRAQDDAHALKEHLLMGDPSQSRRHVDMPDDHRMVKKQYVLSYNRYLGIPNWVAWHTDSTWLGPLQRSNDFRADSTLPESWYHVSEKSYRKSGYDRGHMCPSGDRTADADDNSATFLMTNMVPQAGHNNQGPWAALEIYCRDLVKEGKELYIYCGGNGSRGFIDSGRVQVPNVTWKAVLVLDAGNDDLHRVTSSSRTIAVVMPNDNALIRKSDDWRMFAVSVDSVESLTGYDLFRDVPASIQSIIEKRVEPH